MGEKQEFQCTGNCMRCIPAQRTYCASQHAYSNMKVLDNMMGIVVTMQGDIKALSEKIEAIQNSEANIFPTHEEKSEIPNIPIAQEGAGA